MRMVLLWMQCVHDVALSAGRNTCQCHHCEPKVPCWPAHYEHRGHCKQSPADGRVLQLQVKLLRLLQTVHLVALCYSLLPVTLPHQLGSCSHATTVGNSYFVYFVCLLYISYIPRVYLIHLYACRVRYSYFVICYQAVLCLLAGGFQQPAM